MAFHPDYATNGRFFVNYTDAVGTTIVQEYNRSASSRALLTRLRHVRFFRSLNRSAIITAVGWTLGPTIIFTLQPAMVGVETIRLTTHTDDYREFAWENVADQCEFR